MNPDLSAAAAWLAARDPAERKRRGTWPTPYWLCTRAVESLPLAAGDVVLDPACGDGRWLVAAAHRTPGVRLIGFDADPLAIEAARSTLAAAGMEADLAVRDSLTDPPWPACDWIVGNPPFVRPQQLERQRARALWARYPLATDKCDLSACFVARALETGAPLALVLPAALLSLASWRAVREALTARGLHDVYACPTGAFDAVVEAVLVVVGPSDRRVAGHASPDGLTQTGEVHVSSVWSLADRPPDLPGLPLGTYVRVHMGIVCGDYPRYVHAGRRFAEDQPTCRGRDVVRWKIHDRGEYVRYVPNDMLARKPYVAPKHAALFDVPAKIVVAGTTGREIRAALDTARRFPLDSCYVVHPREPEVDLHAVLGLLLSRPVQAWYGARFGAPRVKGVELAQIPVPPPPWDGIAEAARAHDDAAVDEAVLGRYARAG